MGKDENGAMNPLLSALLYPLSLPYGLLVRLDRQLAAARDMGRPVISVGNITWGGTGKTPVVIHLSRELLRRGKRVAVLTRGYGRKGNGGPVTVSDGTQIMTTPEAAGDEPVLLSRSIPGAVVIAGADRRRSAALAIERFSPDVFVLDDGYQHWKARRDLDIVCINARNPFGNGRLIPAGILREPPAALARAGLVLLTNAELAADDELQRIEETVVRHTSAPCLRIGRRVVGVTPVVGGETVRFEECRGRGVVALSALGENAGFRRTLEQNGHVVLRHFAFRDHHWFTYDELQDILQNVPAQTPILTTTKDAVRLAALMKRLPEGQSRRFFALTADIYFMKNGDELWEKRIQDALRSSLTGTGR